MADRKFWKLYDFRTTLYSGVFGVADYEFQIEFQNEWIRIILFYMWKHFTDLLKKSFKKLKDVNEKLTALLKEVNTEKCP